MATRQSKVDWDKIPVVIVPADKLSRNPENPFDRLTAEERHARFIALLAQIRSEMEAKRTSDDEPRQAA